MRLWRPMILLLLCLLRLLFCLVHLLLHLLLRLLLLLLPLLLLLLLVLLLPRLLLLLLLSCKLAAPLCPLFPPPSPSASPTLGDGSGPEPSHRPLSASTMRGAMRCCQAGQRRVLSGTSSLPIRNDSSACALASAGEGGIRGGIQEAVGTQTTLQNPGTFKGCILLQSTCPACNQALPRCRPPQALQQPARTPLRPPDTLAQLRSESTPGWQAPPSACVRASTMAVASPTPSTEQSSRAACSSGLSAARSSLPPCARAGTRWADGAAGRFAARSDAAAGAQQVTDPRDLDRYCTH